MVSEGALVPSWCTVVLSLGKSTSGQGTDSLPHGFCVLLQRWMVGLERAGWKA